MTSLILFIVFSVLVLAGGLGVVLVRDPVRGALCLISSFFGLACLFILQSAEFIAVLEVLIYAGAIMVLFVFVIMLVENRETAIIGGGIGQQLMLPLKIAGAGTVGYVLFRAVSRLDVEARAPIPRDFGQVESVARLLFAKYLFHFEFTSILLMAAIVGAVVVSRRGGNP